MTNYDIDEDRDVSIDEMLAFLNRDGDLGCPGSRYGVTTSECAPWAVACQLIYWDANGSGDSPLSDSLDYYMGLVVNDSDSVLELVADYPSAIKHCGHDDVEYVVVEAEEMLRDEIATYLQNLNAPTLLRLRLLTADPAFCWGEVRDLC